MDEPKIVLDQSTFKALATGTRVKILKTLEKRRHTQSELSTVLDMSVPTVKEHLNALVDAGLVKRHEEGRKWIYYSLTEKSKCVLDPERKRLWIVLGFFVLSAVGTILSVKKYLTKPVVMGARTFAAKEAAVQVAVDSAEEAAVEMIQSEAVPTAAKAAPTLADAVPQAAPEAINQAVVSSQPPYVMIGLIVLTVILFILAIYFYKRSKLGKPLKKK
ncbi:metalloregulator ArsR/SmtB family transcription factor [Candidatus Woesearchaeota archaeon]|nr:metalloregulator ArsR/SmtB family transcription factor [Candidatus Woesearchaeota archaeon]